MQAHWNELSSHHFMKERAFFNYRNIKFSLIRITQNIDKYSIYFFGFLRQIQEVFFQILRYNNTNKIISN